MTSSPLPAQPEPGATERALDGLAELRALAAYVAAPTADVLAGPATALWASARLLDSLVTISHGSTSPISAAVRTAVDPANGIAAWPDLDGAYRPDDAGLLLGVYAFSENYCDTGLGSVAHLGSIVIPALLIAAQERVVTGRDALAAIAVGYNVMEYLGATVNGGRPRMASQLKGFRPTASAGPVAALAVLAPAGGPVTGGMRQAPPWAAARAAGCAAHPSRQRPRSGSSPARPSGARCRPCACRGRASSRIRTCCGHPAASSPPTGTAS